jgi:hypothetical protein
MGGVTPIQATSGPARAAANVVWIAAFASRNNGRLSGDRATGAGSDDVPVAGADDVRVNGLLADVLAGKMAAHRPGS